MWALGLLGVRELSSWGPGGRSGLRSGELGRGSFFAGEGGLRLADPRGAAGKPAPGSSAGPQLLLLARAARGAGSLGLAAMLSERAGLNVRCLL